MDARKNAGVVRDEDPPAIEVPRWVPERLSDVYVNIAERDGEEEAASVCRRLKNGTSVRLSAGHGASSRLPAVVSPAGC